MAFSRTLWLLLPAALLLPAQDSLLSRPEVKQAMAYLEQHHEEHLARQVRISEIPAPTFHEERRGAFMAAEFRRLGLKNVETDARGNVLGWREGRSPRALAVAAHLDTVFPEATDLKVKREGARMNGPGLADDSRGLAALLALVEALNAAKITTEKSLLFVANCCEEGLGDLMGVKELFQKSPHRQRIDAFISIDGTDPSRIVHRALASKRYRIAVSGPGGHSWGNFGRPSPIHAIGRIIARFADVPVPTKPRTSYNVGTIAGGTSINSIAFKATMEVDMRSENDAELEKLEQALLAAAKQGVEEENRARAQSGARLELESKLLATRYGGTTPENSPLVQAALRAARATGHEPELTISSTDSNVPINLGIPAVTMGGGGKSGNAHSLEEWFDPTAAWKGPQTVLLTILGYDAAK